VSEGRPSKLEVYSDLRVAAEYDKRWDGPLGRARNARKARAIRGALAALGSPDDVLDAPCGNGRFSALLSSDARRYVGADLALPMLADARARHAACAYVAADLARLPFADRAFEAAVCIRFLHLVRARELAEAGLEELAWIPVHRAPWLSDKVLVVAQARR
jgi:ubiquinone/menaquinone biosynthesis C-methylase UbiE